MQETALLDAIERYIRGEMLPEEKAFFEHLRKTTPSIDQMVVEHTLLLEQMGRYGEIKDLKSRLNEIHYDLAAAGNIRPVEPAKVITLWKKYKRVIGVAASIAGITALGISGLVSYFSPKVSNEDVKLLNRRLTAQEQQVYLLKNKLNEGSGAVPPAIDFKSGGTGFLIDGKGYLITNAHVVKNATNIDVQNKQGEFHARIIYQDPETDLALLKIEDTAYKAMILPYGISKTGARLSEDVWTLGYPRPEIVYGKGYMSAQTGHNGDTLTYQITVAANPGNSGTPVLNKDGEVVGIIRSSQQDAQGMVFAIRSKNIFLALDAMRADSTITKIDSSFDKLKVPQVSSVKGLDRMLQVEKTEDCIFIVKRN